MIPKFTAISYWLVQATAAFILQALIYLASSTPWMMEWFLWAAMQWRELAQLGYEWVGETIGYDEFLGIVFITLLLILAFQTVSYILHKLFELIIWWFSRHGNMDSRLFEKQWDHRPVVQEAAHGGGELVIKLTKELPYIVMIWITTQSDGLMTKATPILVGFGYRDGNGIRTAGHCLASAVKVFISRVGDERCVEVPKWTRSQYEDDAYLDCPNQCAILGVRKAPMKFPKPGMACDVLTYNKDSNTFYMTHTILLTRRGEKRINDDPRYVYTMSNTHGGDSGLPVLQGGGVIATHIGSYPAGKCNGHFIPVSAFKAYVPNHISKDVTFAAVTPDGVITESPVHNGGRSEGDSLFDEIDRQNEAEDEFYSRREKYRFEEEEEERRVRQRGEHLDDQGFRMSRNRKTRREENDRLLDDPDSWANLMDLETGYVEQNIATTPEAEVEALLRTYNSAGYKSIVAKAHQGLSSEGIAKYDEHRHARVLDVASRISDEHVANIAAKTTDRALSQKLKELLAKRVGSNKKEEKILSTPDKDGELKLAVKVASETASSGGASPNGIALASAKQSTQPPAQRAGKSPSSTTSTPTQEKETTASAKSQDEATQKPNQESQKPSKSSKRRGVVKQLKVQLEEMKKQLEASQAPLTTS